MQTFLALILVFIVVVGLLTLIQSIWRKWRNAGAEIDAILGKDRKGY